MNLSPPTEVELLHGILATWAAEKYPHLMVQIFSASVDDWQVRISVPPGVRNDYDSAGENSVLVVYPLSEDIYFAANNRDDFWHWRKANPHWPNYLEILAECVEAGFRNVEPRRNSSHQ